MDTYYSNFNANSYVIRLFEHFDFSQNTVECLEFDGKLALTTTGEAGELDNRTNSGPETKMNNSLLTFLLT